MRTLGTVASLVLMLTLVVIRSSSQSKVVPATSGKEVSAAEYDRAMRLLPSMGIEFIKQEDRRKGTFQGRSAYFHDPDRNVIEIIDLVRGPVGDDESTS